MLSRMIRASPKQPIELPKPKIVIPVKADIVVSKSTESLSAMCNFDPHVIACTPPDGYFIHNLHLRMGKL